MPKKGKRTKVIKGLLIVLWILIIWLALQYLTPALTSKEVKSFVEKLGFWGPLAIIFYITLSHILAPLAGSPGIFLSISIFGIFKTLIYIYVGSLISAVIGFYISRRFGRKWVAKLAGRKTMNEIDNFVKASGTKILILSRLFGFSLFEVVSYAAGLTNIKFKKYFIITLIFAFIPSLILTYFFRNKNFSSVSNILVWIATIMVTGIIFSFFIKKFLQKTKES